MRGVVTPNPPPSCMQSGSAQKQP